MTEYTKEDLERARNTRIKNDWDIAQLIADVRREAYERAAKECEALADEYHKEFFYDHTNGCEHAAERIRGLK